MVVDPSTETAPGTDAVELTSLEMEAAVNLATGTVSVAPMQSSGGDGRSVDRDGVSGAMVDPSTDGVSGTIAVKATSLATAMVVDPPTETASVDVLQLR